MIKLKRNNVFLPNINCTYTLKIAERLIQEGLNVDIIGIRKNNKDKIYKKKIKQFISKFNSNVIIQEDFFYPSENFENLDNKDFSWVSIDNYKKINYYEKLFILSLDRNAFFPISNLKSTRLFYNIFSYLYKKLCVHDIHSIVFFGTPHGYPSIVLWAVAEYLGIKIIYTEGSGINPMFSTIENTLNIKRIYKGIYSNLGILSNENHKQVEDIVKRDSSADFYTRNNSSLKVNKLFIKRILALGIKNLFLIYETPELFLLNKPTRGFSFLIPLINYYLSIIKARKFLSSVSISKIPKNNSKKILSFFLHQQPEASTMPLAGIFADQILAFNIISESLSSDYQILVKEHPYFYVDAGAERHERSLKFYSHYLKDKRVTFVSNSVSSNDLIKKSDYVVSIAGTVGWQALKIGKPCIIFGNAWFSQCKSCFIVDSNESLKIAFKKILKLKKEIVEEDVKEFLSSYSKRLIYAPPSQQSFIEGSDLMESFNLNSALKNISTAIKLALKDQ